MRIALISDLHGNVLALEQVLWRITRRGVDAIVCLGDVATLGPEPERLIELLRESGATCVLGNHDEFMLSPELVAEYTTIPSLVDSIDWCRARLSSDSLTWLRTFHSIYAIDLENGEQFLAFHGTPASNTTDLLSTTEPNQLDEWLDGTVASLLAGGHTHLQMLRQHRGRLLINPGRVGMPFKEYVAGGPPQVLPRAEYAIIESDAASASVSLEHVALNKDALRKSVLAVDYPLAKFLAAAYS